MELQRNKTLRGQREKDDEQRRWHELIKPAVIPTVIPVTSHRLVFHPEMPSNKSDLVTSGEMHSVHLSKGSRALGMTITSSESQFDDAESGIQQVAFLSYQHHEQYAHFIFLCLYCSGIYRTHKYSHLLHAYICIYTKKINCLIYLVLNP